LFSPKPILVDVRKAYAVKSIQTIIAIFTPCLLALALNRPSRKIPTIPPDKIAYKVKTIPSTPSFPAFT